MVPSGVGERYRAMCQETGRLEVLWDPQEIGIGQGRLPKVFCCRDGDRTRRLDLSKQKKRKSAGSLYGFLSGLAYELARSACWSWGLG